MNYWLNKRKRSLDYSIEVTRGSTNKIVFNEFYLDNVVFDQNQQVLIMKCNYDSNIESAIRTMLTPGIISDHQGELRIYKNATLRECWVLPMMKYINLHRPWQSQKMFFSVTSYLIGTIKSSFIL